MAQEIDEDGGRGPLTAGAKLRDARIASGLELDEIAARTRVSKRHLAAIEEDRYSDLASRTYAIGFSRSYARALGLDEHAVADDVRRELARQAQLEPRTQRTENFEPGDPARVPPSLMAWVAGIGAVVLLALLFVFWRNLVDPSAPLPDLAADAPTASAKAKAAAAVPSRPGAQPGAASGPVTLTALEQGVWIKVDGAAGEQLFQKELALGESYTLPPGTNGAVLQTARPDALRVEIGTRRLERLRQAPEILRGLPLTPEGLLSPQPQGTPSAPGAAQTSTVSDR